MAQSPLSSTAAIVKKKELPDIPMSSDAFIHEMRKL